MAALRTSGNCRATATRIPRRNRAARTTAGMPRRIVSASRPAAPERLAARRVGRLDERPPHAQARRGRHDDQRQLEGPVRRHELGERRRHREVQRHAEDRAEQEAVQEEDVERADSRERASGPARERDAEIVPGDRGRGDRGRNGGHERLGPEAAVLQVGHGLRPEERRRERGFHRGEAEAEGGADEKDVDGRGGVRRLRRKARGNVDPPEVHESGAGARDARGGDSASRASASRCSRRAAPVPGKRGARECVVVQDLAVADGELLEVLVRDAPRPRLRRLEPPLEVAPAAAPAGARNAP